MAFGHGVFDHMAGNTTFGASQSFDATGYEGGGVKAGIQTIDCGYPTNAPSGYTGQTAIITTGRNDTTTYEVYYSSTKTGLKVQNLPTKAYAKNYAETYDPTGYWSDHTSSPTREDGTFSEWGEWSECADGSQSRTRTVIPAVCHGKPPIGQVTEQQVCETSGSAGDTTITTQSTAIAIAPAGMSPLLKMGIVFAGIGIITFFVS